MASKSATKPRPAEDRDVMREKVGLTVNISRESRILLDSHVGLNRGTTLGSASAVVEDLIVRHLREIRLTHRGDSDA